jgi:hypothetical protein
MSADDAFGDELGDGRSVVAAVLDVVQRCRADLQPFFVLVVPVRDARVEIPAVVVEACRIGDAPDLVKGFVLFSSSRNPTTTSATWTPVSSM